MSDQATAVAQGGSYDKPKRDKNLHIRDKIRAAVILERLERNALGELDPPMTRDQIKSAEITLKKVIPDLSSVTISGDDEKPLKTITQIELTAPSGYVEVKD